MSRDNISSSTDPVSILTFSLVIAIISGVIECIVSTCDVYLGIDIHILL